MRPIVFRYPVIDLFLCAVGPAFRNEAIVIISCRRFREIGQEEGFVENDLLRAVRSYVIVTVSDLRVALVIHVDSCVFQAVVFSWMKKNSVGHEEKSDLACVSDCGITAEVDVVRIIEIKLNPIVVGYVNVRV
jgi:hypothetical protein